MLKTHMAACLVATMFAAPAFAQAPAAPATAPATPNSSTTAPAMPATAPANSAAMPANDAGAMFLTKIEVNHILASKLIGTKVISANNESVGDINDVIVDRNGQAVAAIVGVGGFLGIGEKDVAVPFKSLEFATREQVSAMTKKNVAATGSTAVTAPANPAVNAPASATTTTTTTTTMPAVGTEIDGEPERVVLRMTKAQLQSAPAFDADREVKARATTGTTTTAPMTPATPAPKP